MFNHVKTIIIGFLVGLLLHITVSFLLDVLGNEIIPWLLGVLVLVGWCLMFNEIIPWLLGVIGCFGCWVFWCLMVGVLVNEINSWLFGVLDVLVNEIKSWLLGVLDVLVSISVGFSIGLLIALIIIICYKYIYKYILERQVREQQVREQQVRERQMREQQVREQQVRERQMREQQVREQQVRERQMREQQSRISMRELFESQCIIGECPLCIETRILCSPCVNLNCKEGICLDCNKKILKMTVDSSSQMGQLSYGMVTEIRKKCPFCNRFIGSL